MASSSQTSRQSRHKRIQKSLKSYLIIDDLYRMFHAKKQPYQPPHQTRITSFFKPMIKPVRKSKRNTLPIITTQALSLASPDALKREIPPIRSRKSADQSFQKICFRFAPENPPRRNALGTLYIPRRLHCVSSYTPQSVWQNTKRGPQLEEVENTK